MNKFDSVKTIKAMGFDGFYSMAKLFTDSDIIPEERGVYMVVRNSPSKPVYLEVGVGGHFKGKDPNVGIMTLQESWVENAIVMYIGKAGGSTSTATLRSRLKQYLRFGQGGKVGHWGGRYIWQLEDYKDLLLCWKPILDKEPAAEEVELISKFRNIHGKRPFANLKL